MIRSLFAISILLIYASGSALSQPERCPLKKVAFYDEYTLNSKDGVKRFYDAYNAAIDTGFISCPVDIESSKKRFDARKKILVEPVLNDIRKALADVAHENEIVLLEITALENKELILATNKDFDVSRQLIEYLNRPRSEAPKVIRMNVQQSRVVRIDSTLFFDPQRGIRGFALAPGENAGTFCDRTKKCGEIGSFLQEYARKNGISLIFDSSKSLSEEINSLPCEDLTSDFVSEYNKHLLSLSGH